MEVFPCYDENERTIDNTNDLVLTCLRFFTLSPLDVVVRFSRFSVPPLKVVLFMSTQSGRRVVFEAVQDPEMLENWCCWES